MHTNIPSEGEPTARTMVVILMGVSGAGKTTVGKRLADELGWPFYDGDDFHPQANVDKMARGVPLVDEDRWPWLRAIRAFIHERLQSGEPAIIACSALKQSYRNLLRDGNKEIRLVYLKGDFDVIQHRLQARKDHFFDADLLASQFDALEEPDPDDALIVDIDKPPDEIVRIIKRALLESDAA